MESGLKQWTILLSVAFLDRKKRHREVKINKIKAKKSVVLNLDQKF